MENIELKDNGTWTVPLLAEDRTAVEWETHAGAVRMLRSQFGPPREPGSAITQDHMDVAAAIQSALHACLLHALRHFKRMTGQKNLCMAGGVALNCTANGVIQRSRLFQHSFVQPAAGDDGTAVGAALYVQRQMQPETARRRMAMPYWGPGYSRSQIDRAVSRRPECEVFSIQPFRDLCKHVADRIATGQIVAWFQGRMEFGPRALGHRSILADPRNPVMRDTLNRLVKNREDFRPFAPAVTAETASQFFDLDPQDAFLYHYMLSTAPVRSHYRDRLPAVTHVDGSARVQIVSCQDDDRFWTLLSTFGDITGLPILLNTSLNVRGQPIVCSPVEAIDTFLRTRLDVLVIGDFIVTRRDQSRESDVIPEDHG